MDHFNSIIGQSPALDSLIRSAKMVAVTDVTILLIGETGTGKEVFANAIQKESPRADKVFITLNCAAYLKASLNRSYLVIKKVHLQAQQQIRKVFFKQLTGAPYSLMKLVKFPPHSRPNCCAYCKKVNLKGWAERIL